MRSALGAPRGRLIRLLMFESLLLAFGGAVFGVVFAVATTQVVAASTSIEIPMLRTVAVDGSALLFACLTAFLAGLCVGILPALRLVRGSEATFIKSSARGSSTGRHSTRLLEGLVVSEVALACVLLVFGGLLLKSFRQVLDVELGFQPAGLVAWQINTARDFESLAEANAFFDQLIASVTAIPGVEAAGLTDAAPLGRNRTWGLRAPGVEYEGSKNLFAFPHIVDRRYLQTMQIPLVAGRQFTVDDTRETEGAILLNESAAKAVYRGEEALGRVVRTGGTDYRVVGIVADVRHLSLEQGAGLEMYLPLTQSGDFGTLDMVVRSRLPAASLTGSVAAALQAVDPAMPTGDHQTLDSIVDRDVSPRRFTLLLLGAFAGAALLLATLGIYGVLSTSVTERTREIGIRMALGESESSVLRRVLGKTLLLAGLGVSLGAAGSFAMSRVLNSLLYNVEPTDPLTFLGMATVLLAVSGLAGLLPGLRASRTDPVVVLRST